MYEQSASWMPQDPLLTQYGRWTIQQRGRSASPVPGCTSYCQNTTGTVGWENSRHLTTPLLVSSRNKPRNSILMTCHYPDQGLVLLIGWCKFPTWHDQSEALPRYGYWRVISMEFLHSFLRRHFAEKPSLKASDRFSTKFFVTFYSIIFQLIRFQFEREC